ncbi:MAG: tail protein X [Alphaproteobacteria bacterium]|jgi:phage tail protein X|nr:tail protein X [Alphaproteobacteria bacterium]
MKYITKDNDCLDHICWKHYGKTDGKIVEQVLEENRHLKNEGALLKAGLKITLPEIKEKPNNQKIKLW